MRDLAAPALVQDIASGVIVQGVTGRVGRRHLAAMLEYGTSVLAGVSPGHGGETCNGIPVFETVAEAVTHTGAPASISFLPPEAVGDGLMEAVDAGIRVAVSVTEGADLHDMLPALQYARYRSTTVIGPNSAGVLLPGQALLGFLPARFARPGRVAVLSRSGTLSYEVVFALARAGVGESIWIGVGGDSVKGSTFAHLLPLVADVPGTEAIVLVGEIGGQDEQDAAPVLAGLGLPTVALLAGRTAPAGVPMGHAGAIIDGRAGSYDAKAQALAEAGTLVCRTPAEIAQALADLGMAGPPRSTAAAGRGLRRTQ